MDFKFNILNLILLVLKFYEILFISVFFKISFLKLESPLFKFDEICFFFKFALSIAELYLELLNENESLLI